jgi:hypothetical protein
MNRSAASCVVQRSVGHRTGAKRTSENSEKAKFAELFV